MISELDMDARTTVLIVDDDPHLRKTLTDLLLNKGYRPIAVSGGTAALGEIDKLQPVVTLIDLKMRDMSGLELLAKVRRRFPDTECIVITGYASRETAIEAINLGAYSYVEKPYDVDQLLLTIKRAIEKQVSETELRWLKEFHESIVQNMTEGIVIENLQGYVTFVNPATGKLLGFSPNELLGKHWTEFCPVDQRPIIESAHKHQRQETGSARYEVELLRKDNQRVPVLVSGCPLFEGDHQVGTLAVFTDITEQKKAEEKMRYLSTHDALTGLYSRGFFEEEMERLERGRLYPLSIVMVDVDDLKMINDTFGHEAGDNILRHTASILKKTFRADDIVARIGGDEFAVLLPSADAPVVQNALVRLKNELLAQNSLHFETSLSLSLGAATIERGESLAYALKDADGKMYKEKIEKRGLARPTSSPPLKGEEVT